MAGCQNPSNKVPTWCCTLLPPLRLARVTNKCKLNSTPSLGGSFLLSIFFSTPFTMSDRYFIGLLPVSWPMPWSTLPGDIAFCVVWTNIAFVGKKVKGVIICSTPLLYFSQLWLPDSLGSDPLADDPWKQRIGWLWLVMLFRIKKEGRKHLKFFESA